jgi:predicted membrane channel-forming protein YqfA (hemolysin III family)
VARRAVRTQQPGGSASAGAEGKQAAGLLPNLKILAGTACHTACHCCGMTTWCCSCHQFGTAGNVTIAAPYAVAGTQVAAALLDVQWPTARWPVYVFLAGAMACLLTSAMCHLLACCSFEAGSAAAELEPSGLVQCSYGGIWQDLQCPCVSMCRSISSSGGWITQVRCWPDFNPTSFRVWFMQEFTSLLMSTCFRCMYVARGSSTSLRCLCHPAGIAVLIVASFFPPVYYGFMCHLPTQIFYLTTTTALGTSPLLCSGLPITCTVPVHACR